MIPTEITRYATKPIVQRVECIDGSATQVFERIERWIERWHVDTSNIQLLCSGIDPLVLKGEWIKE